MSLEEQIAKLTATVETLQSMVVDLSAELRKTREEVRPKLLRRPQLAEMLGLSPEGLRKTLSRGKSGESILGAKLLELAFSFGGEQCWRPSDIAAHCTRWTKGGGE